MIEKDHIGQFDGGHISKRNDGMKTFSFKDREDSETKDKHCGSSLEDDGECSSDERVGDATMLLSAGTRYTEGTFFNLFDPQKKKFDYGNNKGFASYEECKAAFNHVLPEMQRTKMEKQEILLLEKSVGKEEVKSAMTPQQIAEGMFDFSMMSKELATVVTKFYSTPTEWDGTRDFGGMIVYVFIQLCHLQVAMKERLALNSKRVGVVRNNRNGKCWKNMMNSLACVYCAALYDGGWDIHTSRGKLEGYFGTSGPFCQFVVFPILRMIRGLFPLCYDFDYMCMKTPESVLKQYRKVALEHGSYSNSHLSTILWEMRRRENADFLKGLEYDVLLVFSSLTPYFTDQKLDYDITNRTRRQKIRDKSCWYNMTDAEKERYVSGSPSIVLRADWNRKVYSAGRLYRPLDEQDHPPEH